MVADVALAQRLGEELKYENEAAPAAEPDFLKAFKAQGTWAVSDQRGWLQFFFAQRGTS